MKPFECKRCGTCCYGEGGISVEDAEIEKISAFLGLFPHTFVETCCVQKHEKTYVACRPDGFCLFCASDGGCRIHPVKPKPCSLWPFYPALLGDRENWESAKDACPGINPNCSFEDFVRQSEE